MRFNFKNVGEGIGALGDAYNKVRLGRMYDEASKQQEQFTPTETTNLEGYDNQYFKNDDGNYELKSNYDDRGRLIAGLKGDLAYPTRPSSANETPQESPDVYARRQAVLNTPPDTRSGVVVPSYGEDTKRYGLGANPTEFRDTPYTPAERRTAGLEAQADFLLQRGDTEAANKILDQVQSRRQAGLQEEYTRGQIKMQPGAQSLQEGAILLQKENIELATEAKAARGRVRTIFDSVKGVSPINMLLANYGADTGVGAEGAAKGRKFSATPGIQDGKDGHFISVLDRDGNPDPSKAPVFKTNEEITLESQRVLLTQLAAADPEKYMAAAMTAGHSAAALKATIDHQRVTEINQAKTLALTGKRLDQAIKAADQHHAEAMARLKQMGESLGRPLGVSDDGTKLLYDNPKGGRLIEIPVPDGFSKLFPKVTGDKPVREIPAETVRAFSTRYFAEGVTPEAQLAMRTDNPAIAAAAGIGVTPNFGAIPARPSGSSESASGAGGALVEEPPTPRRGAGAGNPAMGLGRTYTPPVMDAGSARGLNFSERQVRQRALDDENLRQYRAEQVRRAREYSSGM